VSDAVISIGTNSTRLLHADVDGARPRILTARSVGTRIGEKLRERGRLGDEPMRRTLEVVAQYAAEIGTQARRTHLIATSALRRADNAAAFGRAAGALANAPLHIISGEEEAIASYRGAMTELAGWSDARVGVADVGGGSTEFACGVGNIPERVASCEIGAVRLTERIPELSGADGPVPAEALQRARLQAWLALASLDIWARVQHLAIVGGTATNAVALLRGESDAFTTLSLARADVGRALEMLCGISLEERKALPGINPQRADILAGGLIVIEALFERVGVHVATVCTSDVLMGYLLIQRENGRT
jgi:exopolyphosphatase/guanosine-5'-triphosphate,3'-diphosphate pyrophosphatase